jgi:hypothetical protein
MSVSIPLLPLYVLVAWMEENLLFVCLFVFLSFALFLSLSLSLNAEHEGCNGKKWVSILIYYSTRLVGESFPFVSRSKTLEGKSWRFQFVQSRHIKLDVTAGAY